MPITRIPLPEPTVDFTAKCKEWLRRATEQKALAKETVAEDARSCGRDEETAKSPLASTRILIQAWSFRPLILADRG